MKETLDSIDKLQVDLDEANVAMLALENRATIAKDQVTILECKVQELQSQVEENQAISNRIVDLEAEI